MDKAAALVSPPGRSIQRTPFFLIEIPGLINFLRPVRYFNTIYYTHICVFDAHDHLPAPVQEFCTGVATGAD